MFPQDVTGSGYSRWLSHYFGNVLVPFIGHGVGAASHRRVCARDVSTRELSRVKDVGLRYTVTCPLTLTATKAHVRSFMAQK